MQVRLPSTSVAVDECPGLALQIALKDPQQDSFQVIRNMDLWTRKVECNDLIKIGYLAIKAKPKLKRKVNDYQGPLDIPATKGSFAVEDADCTEPV